MVVVHTVTTLLGDDYRVAPCLALVAAFREEDGARAVFVRGSVGVELGPAQGDGSGFWVDGCPFLVVLLAVDGGESSFVEGALWAQFALADHAVEDLIAAPIGAFGVAQVEIVQAPLGVGNQARVAPYAVGTFYFLLGPCGAAVRALVEVVQDAARIDVLGVAGIHADAGFADARSVGGAFVDFYGLALQLGGGEECTEEQGLR